MAEPNGYKVYETDLTDFQPDAANANRGTERGAGMIRKSIQEVGAGRSLVADKNNVIPAGNKTQEAAVDIGMTRAIVVETDGDAVIVHKRRDWDLSDPNPNNPARKYAYFDNRTSQVDLDFDSAQIAADLGAGIDLSGMWSNLEVKGLLADLPTGEAGDAEPQVDRAAELQEKWQTATGQRWKIGEHSLFVSSADLAGIECDLAIYDPPFDWSATQQENALHWARWKTAALMGRENCMPLASRTDLWHWWIWDAGMNRFGGRGHNPVTGCAIILLFGEHRWFEAQGLSALDRHDIVHYEWPTQVVHIQDHLAGREYKHEKPAGLADYIVSLYSDSGDMVGDLFAGSGAFGIACERLKRVWRGAEIDPGNAAVVLERFSEAFGITGELIQ
jgi:hypothetical protein